ncbi:hypothetical protein SDC9_50508 [bioreactor metagenome]|uniref:Uncharacterized protein n=1 Tax=bioreactor metagenome TaxID=1076179 RepID=A0A644WPK4_9ZZZZ
MEQQPGHGDSRRAGSHDDGGSVRQFLFHQLQGVLQSRKDNHRRAVLVVAENGDVQLFLETFHHGKGVGARHVLDVDCPEGGSRHLCHGDDVIGIPRLDAERDGVHVAEVLEEQAFALHHGQRRPGTDVAHAQDCRAVADESEPVSLPRIFEDGFRILHDTCGGVGAPLDVGHAEVFLVPYVHRGVDPDLPPGIPVQLEGLFPVDVHCVALPPSRIFFLFSGRHSLKRGRSSLNSGVPDLPIRW